MAKAKGFSSDPRVRERQHRLLEIYAEMAPDIGGEPVKDRAAMITAVERSGIDQRLTRENAKVAKFMRLWKSDESRAYLCELWGNAVEQNPDPVSLAMQLLHTHATQTDESWGARDRGSSLTAIRMMTSLFIPAQTTKIASMHVSAKIERPEIYDQEPVMESRSILPAGTKIVAPTGPTGSEEEDDDDDDDD